MAALPQVLQDSAGNTYVYGLDLISKTDSGGSQQYYLCDGLGSTTGLTDGSGSVVATYQYDVYGAVRAQSGGSGNEFTFTGEQNDSTGLEYLRARYYDNATGRFLGRDPLPLLQRYPYAANNPVMFIDPLGLCGVSSWSDFGECFKPVVQPISQGLECVHDVSCSQHVSQILDRTAATVSTFGAIVSNSFMVAGCVSTGPVGCLLGKWVGEIAAAGPRTASNFLSMGSMIISCSGSFFGDGKEGGGFTRSNITECGGSVFITGIGLIPESDIDAIAADYQACRSTGHCWP